MSITWVNNALQRVFLPEHLALLQSRVSLSLPEHFRPPYEGFGLSQERVLNCRPPPHVREHVEKGAHGPQLPSTRLRGVGVGRRVTTMEEWCIIFSSIINQGCAIYLFRYSIFNFCSYPGH